MAEEPKVSVVMPVYNGQQYLHEAVDGILAQTLVDFELICVNDGSTDESADILDGYVKQDARVRVLHEDNRGVSAARNTGLAAARGVYVMFCDDDDLFEPDMLEKMVGKMDACAADVCVPNGYKLDMADNGRVIKGNFVNAKFVPEGEWFSPREAGRYLLNFSTFYIYKMYRRVFLLEHGIEFGTQKVEEDALFFTHALLVARRVVVISDRVFYYRLNTGDSVSDLIFKNDMLAGFESMLIVKDLMQRLGMYDDPAFHQSYVNRALTKTMNYRGRAKDFASLNALYVRLVQEGGMAEMDLVGHDAEYFYNPKHFEELEVLRNSETVNNYLFYLYDKMRKDFVRKSRRSRDLKDENRRLKQDLRNANRELSAIRKKSIVVGEGVKRALGRLKRTFST